VCNKPCHYDVLVLDTLVFKCIFEFNRVFYSYFAEIIGKANGVNEVELLTDGNWRVIEEKPSKKPVVSNVAGTSAPPSIVKPESVDSLGNTPAPSKPPQSAPEIITLDDSDEDDEPQSLVPNDPVSASTSSKQSESRKRPHDQISAVGERQDYTVIFLSVLLCSDTNFLGDYTGRQLR
jgi:hypothetical protein